MLFSRRITIKPLPRSVDLIVILYAFSAIFNRAATGFILCFSEHFRVRRGLGWSLNKLKSLRFRLWRKSEVLGVCGNKDTACQFSPTVYQDFLKKWLRSKMNQSLSHYLENQRRFDFYSSTAISTPPWGRMQST